MMILLLLSALGLSFAFSPFPFRFLAYLTLVPLFLIIDKDSYKGVFFKSWLFGFFFSLFHLWWLFFLIVPVAPMTKFLLYLGVVVLFIYLGAYTAVFGLITKYCGLVFAPFILAGLEFIRTKSEIGFPWGLLGTTQTPYVPIIQFASIFGVYGISAWILLINLILYWLLTKKRVGYLLLLIILFILPIAFGISRLRPNENWFRVAVIQPNVSPNEKGDWESRNRLVNDLVRLTKKTLTQNPNLLVYPETATLYDITQDNEFHNILRKLIDSSGVSLLTGTPIFEKSPSPKYYNAAVLFEPNKPISQGYKKIHPVPFSEKVPKFFNIFTTVDMGNMTPGNLFKVFNLEIPFPESQSVRAEQVKFSVLICFESIFPDLTQEFTRRGANLLINITNDGWFGKTPGPFQHCELSILRTVENGVPLIRCANNGISLIADPFGRILRKSGLFCEATIVSDLPKPIRPTFFRRYGNQFAFLSIFITIFGIVLKTIRVTFRRYKITI